MQRFKDRRSQNKNPHIPDENNVQKRRIFALVGGLIGVVSIFVYLVSSAYPEKLFSESLNLDRADKIAPPAVVHPVLPNSPLKNSSEAIFAHANQVMARLFAKMGKTYTAPAIQLFQDTITAYECGPVRPASGAFYCPAEKELYIDLSFFRAIQQHDTSGADMVQAYIIGHQLGHYIEDQLGITAKVQAKHASLSDADYAKLNNKLELLADYYAGVWVHYATTKILDNGDAATILGEATLNSTALARNPDIAVPDPYNYFNIGERANAFYRGYANGTLQHDGVFAPAELK